MAFKNPAQYTRRSFLRNVSAAVVLVQAGGLISCAKKEPLLRIASNVWPGYELTYLAREMGYFSPEEIRLIEVPSATVCIQSIAAGAAEGAMLTLDEVLTARAEGLDLRVVSVLDISMGADVVMARPEIKGLEDLVGKRVGVEQSAVGAVMLDAVLDQAGLTTNDITTVYMRVNQHVAAYEEMSVDALVTFEPVRTQLSKLGANQLFDSSQIPGRIVDVLAVMPSAIEASPSAIRKIVKGHFVARDYFLKNKEEASEHLSGRLQLQAEEVPSTYEGIDLPDVKMNHKLLAGESALLNDSIKDLVQVMNKAGLLQSDVDISNMIDGSFLPEAG